MINILSSQILEWVQWLQTYKCNEYCRLAEQLHAWSLWMLNRRWKEERSLSFWTFSPNIPWLDLMWWSRCEVGRLSRIHTTDKVFRIPIKGFVILCKNWLTEISWSGKENLIYFLAQAKDFESFFFLKYVDWFKAKVCWVIFLLKTEVGDCDDLHEGGWAEQCTVPNFMIVATVFKWPQICHMLWCVALLQSYLNTILSFLARKCPNLEWDELFQ